MDTSPNVITEAHAVGLPVIGTAAGGIPDMIDEGRDGFIVPIDDVKPWRYAWNIYSVIRDGAKKWARLVKKFAN